jgi:hypothetical protein
VHDQTLQKRSNKDRTTSHFVIGKLTIFSPKLIKEFGELASFFGQQGVPLQKRDRLAAHHAISGSNFAGADEGCSSEEGCS